MNYSEFYAAIHNAIQEAQATDRRAEYVPHPLETCRNMFHAAHESGNKVIFVGNGGSGAIASHMAIDYTKNGGIRAIALNDHPTLTCVANDFGYENVFAKQIDFYAKAEDVVVVVSTSGKSANILEAASAARNIGCPLVTLSGMRPHNALRTMGDINFYISHGDYGVVEISHLMLLHAIVSCQGGTYERT